MKKVKITALATVILGGISLIFLLLTMLALQDIFHGRQPSFVAEWNMVRVGFIVFWLFHSIAILGSVFVLRTKIKMVNE